MPGAEDLTGVAEVYRRLRHARRDPTRRRHVCALLRLLDEFLKLPSIAVLLRDIAGDVRRQHLVARSVHEAQPKAFTVSFKSRSALPDGFLPIEKCELGVTEEPPEVDGAPARNGNPPSEHDRSFWVVLRANGLEVEQSNVFDEPRGASALGPRAFRAGMGTV